MSHWLRVAAAAVRAIIAWITSLMLGVITNVGLGTIVDKRLPSQRDVLAVAMWSAFAFLFVFPVFLMSLDRLSGTPEGPRALARASATCAVGGVVAMGFLFVRFPSPHWSIEMLLFAIQGAVAGACLPVIYKLLDHT